MFKVSTKGDYGLLLMSSLAEHYGEGFISLKQIADEKHLSVRYLSQLVLPLKKIGLVNSKEGVSGGYELTRKPEEITMLEILLCLEGPVSTVKCTKKGSNCQCEADCGVKRTWQSATEMLMHYLSQKTLIDLIQTKPTSSSKSNVTFTSN